VRARGCGAVLGVFILWCCFFIPGSIVALILQLNKPQEAQAPVIHVYNQPPPAAE
jgi:hypothetical protein